MGKSATFDQGCEQSPIGIARWTTFEPCAKAIDHRCKTGACLPRNGGRGVTQKGNIDA
ncbi:hypothetical protein BCO9919_04875 [Burkholderia cenocepacia]|uniref:Uncharacterized protein n=1 Tax=Burkholderia cenocepacia TaxID=95486 RepID=A0A6J5JJU7_9BURK|nr:hypothetical protein BCO9919_04875 [Burkholderia cenocepacia]